MGILVSYRVDMLDQKKGLIKIVKLSKVGGYVGLNG